MYVYYSLSFIYNKFIKIIHSLLQYSLVNAGTLFPEQYRRMSDLELLKAKKKIKKSIAQTLAKIISQRANANARNECSVTGSLVRFQNTART